MELERAVVLGCMPFAVHEEVFQDTSPPTQHVLLQSLFGPAASCCLTGGVDGDTLCRVLRRWGEIPGAELGDEAAHATLAMATRSDKFLPADLEAAGRKAATLAVAGSSDTSPLAVPFLFPTSVVPAAAPLQAATAAGHDGQLSPPSSVTSVPQGLLYDHAASLRARGGFASMPLAPETAPPMLHTPSSAATFSWPEDSNGPVFPETSMLYCQLRVKRELSSLAEQVWPAAHGLADCCAVSGGVHALQPEAAWPSLTDKRILELGAGTGLVSMIVAHLFPGSAVLATDLPGRPTDSLAHNLTLNQRPAGEAPMPSVCAASLNWLDVSLQKLRRATPEAALQRAGTPLEWLHAIGPTLAKLLSAQVLLAADVLYSEDLCEALVHVLKAVWQVQAEEGLAHSEQSRLILTATLRNPDTVQHFLDTCSTLHIVVHDMSDAWLGPVVRGEVPPTLPLLFNSQHGQKAAAGGGSFVHTLAFLISPPVLE